MELLEREDALAVLARARREGGRGVPVAGDARIGKTAPLTTFAATQDGVLRGGCDALRTPRTLGPLRDIARTAGGELARVMAADSARYDRFSAFLDVLGPATRCAACSARSRGRAPRDGSGCAPCRPA